MAAHGKRLYGYKWSKARALHLTANPLCVKCLARDRITAATVVDHIVPHKGDPQLFWDPANWQSLCKPCHDGAKQQEERLGYSTEVGVDGWPIDPRHPANSPSSGGR